MAGHDEDTARIEALAPGGFVLYGQCGEGFVVDEVFGTSGASPAHFGDPRTPDHAAMFDPESARQAGKRRLRLGYSCIRAQAR